MKKKLSLVLVFCLLICAFGINTNAIEATTKTDAILAEKAQVAAILSANPEYRTMVTASGEERILDADNMVINQIIANIDQVLDVDAYNNGEIDNFFGIDFIEIGALFQEEWIDTIIEQMNSKFGYVITVPYGSDIEAAIEILENNEHISAVSQNEYCALAEASDYDSETGATGLYDLIGVDYAWEHGFTGSSNIRVAVIDTGAAEHPEFDNNMDLTLGFNACFVTNPAPGTSIEDVTPIHPTKPYHGHMVAGIIGADYGDGGVNGICQDITMFPILASGLVTEFHNAFSYAYNMGAKVINYSWSSRNNVLTDQIKNSDALIIMAAGNDSNELNSDEYATECYNLPNVIVVGNSTANDTMASGSNYSATYVDLFAPGENVKSVNYPTGTRSGSGTSYAAPMVAAAAALIRSHATHLTAAQTKDLILNNVDVIPALEDYCVTGGRLAIDKAVDALYDEDRGAYSKGDVNGNNDIDSMDVLLAQRIVNGATLTDIQMSAADVDKNGVVNSTDVENIRGFFFRTCYFPPV